VSLVDLLIHYPAFAVVPALGFAGAALWLGSRTAWIAAGAWCAYILYELGMARLCGGDCRDRLDLLVVYPLLALVTLTALVQLYVHKRERALRRQRRRERRRTIARDMGT
jgi:hypothetical protein